MASISRGWRDEHRGEWLSSDKPNAMRPEVTHFTVANEARLAARQVNLDTTLCSLTDRGGDGHVINHKSQSVETGVHRFGGDGAAPVDQQSYGPGDRAARPTTTFTHRAPQSRREHLGADGVAAGARSIGVASPKISPQDARMESRATVRKIVPVSAYRRH